ncbi:MAG: TolC family protein [Alphaproteobacteria bacterium]
MKKNLLAHLLSWLVMWLLPIICVAQNTKPSDKPSSSQTTENEKPFTLRQALVAAYYYDPRIKAAIENIKAGEATYNATRAARLPQITLSTSYGSNQYDINGEEQATAGEQSGANLGITAPIATFGRQEASEKSAASQLASTRINFQQQKSDLFNEVIQSYFGLLFIEQVYRLKLQNKQLIETQLAEATKRFDREAITITELRAIRTRLNDSNIEALDAAASYITQKQLFASLIGRTDIDNLVVNSSEEFLKTLPTTLKEAKKLLLQNAPAIKETQQAIIRAEAALENARANFFPQLNLQGGISRNIANQEITDQNYATLNMNIILTNGGIGLLQQTQLAAELKRTRYSQASIKNQLLDNLQNNWQSYNSYQQIVKDRADNIKQYEKIYQDTKRALSLGRGTLSNLIDVRSRLLEQYIAYANAVNFRTIFGLSLANNLGMIN